MQDYQYVGLGAELGDAIYGLPAIKALGIRNILAIQRPWCRPDWSGRSKSLKRLAESQPYIDSFEDYTGQSFLDLTTYRSGGMAFGQTIVNRIARWGRVEVDESEPWLQVEPSKQTKGRIIVSRCPRWMAYSWPYKVLMSLFQSEMLFIGADQEYKAFCAEFGMIERLHCQDHLEIAKAIAGSELFIGNQSSPNAICEGLKHQSVLEVSPLAPDCHFARSSTVYSVDGAMEFEACGKRFQSDAIVQQYYMEAGDRIAYGRTPFECETVARTHFVLQGLSLPPLAEIQASIQETHRKAA